jgi:hypothetical protein
MKDDEEKRGRTPGRTIGGHLQRRARQLRRQLTFSWSDDRRALLTVGDAGNGQGGGDGQKAYAVPPHANIRKVGAVESDPEVRCPCLRAPA